MNNEKENFMFQEEVNTSVKNFLQHHLTDFRHHFKNHSTQLDESVKEYVNFFIHQNKNKIISQCERNIEISSVRKMIIKHTNFNGFSLTFSRGVINDEPAKILNKFSVKAVNEHLRDLEIEAFLSLSYEDDDKNRATKYTIEIKNLKNNDLIPFIVSEILRYHEEDFEFRKKEYLDKLKSLFVQEYLEEAWKFLLLLSGDFKLKNYFNDNKDNPNMDIINRNFSKWSIFQ